MVVFIYIALSIKKLQIGKTSQIKKIKCLGLINIQFKKLFLKNFRNNKIMKMINYKDTWFSLAVFEFATADLGAYFRFGFAAFFICLHHWLDLWHGQLVARGWNKNISLNNYFFAETFYFFILIFCFKLLRRFNKTI